MSFLLQKQFFKIDKVEQLNQSPGWIFSDLHQFLFQWSVSLCKQNKLQGMTTQFYSHKYKNLQYMVQFSIQETPTIFNISFYTLKNNIPLKIQSNSHRIKLYGYLLRINSGLSIGKFCICPLSGLIKFNAEIVLTQIGMNQLKNTNIPTVNQRNIPIMVQRNVEIIKKIEDISRYFQMYIQKIFQLINLTQLFERQEQLKYKSSQSEQNTNNYQKQITELQNLVPFIHEDFGYLIKSGFQIKQNKIQVISQKIIDILQIYESKAKKRSLKGIFNYSVQKMKQIMWLQKVNDQKTEISQKIQKPSLLLDKFSVKTVKTISQTNYCSIDLLQGNKSKRKNQFSQKKFNVQFIKKSPLSGKGQKLIIRQDRFIQLYMQQGGKQGIAQYYDVNTYIKQFIEQQSDKQFKIQPLDKNSIFLAYYPNNLSEYINNRNVFFSLNSKLLLLLKIDKSLSYLHFKSCQHMDLKPQNIMVDMIQNIKLIDFGQSIHPKLPLYSKPGVSIPYSPPQFYSKYKFTPSRCDTYSFAVIIFEIIFQELTQSLPWKKQNVISFYQKQHLYQRLFIYQPEKYSFKAENKLSNLIASLCIKCMDLKPQLRPLESWIRIYLKKIIELSFKH